MLTKSEKNLEQIAPKIIEEKIAKFLEDVLMIYSIAKVLDGISKKIFDVLEIIIILAQMIFHKILKNQLFHKSSK